MLYCRGKPKERRIVGLVEISWDWPWHECPLQPEVQLHVHSSLSTIPQLWHWASQAETQGGESILFFKKFLADTCPFLWPLVPLVWISSDVSSGFQSQSGFCLICFFAEANVMYIPWDPPLVLHMCQPLGSQQHSQSLPHMHVQRWDLAQIQTGNHPHRRRTRYHCASDQAAWWKYT